MTTEDTLTAIDATLAGYYDTDVMVSDDAMRWAPEPTEHAERVVYRRSRWARFRVWWRRQWSYTPPPRTVRVDLTVDMSAWNDAWARLNAAVPRTEDVLENAQRLARVLGRSGWSFPARERGTYVENTTSREQEGQ